MSNMNAHAILFVADVATVAGAVVGAEELWSLNRALGEKVTVVHVDSSSPWLLIGIIIPLLHALTLLAPRLTSDALRLRVNRWILYGGVLLFLFIFSLNLLIPQMLENAGYLPCPGTYRGGTVSHAQVWAVGPDACPP